MKKTIGNIYSAPLRRNGEGQAQYLIPSKQSFNLWERSYLLPLRYQLLVSISNGRRSASHPYVAKYKPACELRADALRCETRKKSHCALRRLRSFSHTVMFKDIKVVVVGVCLLLSSFLFLILCWFLKMHLLIKKYNRILESERHAWYHPLFPRHFHVWAFFMCNTSSSNYLPYYFF